MKYDSDYSIRLKMVEQMGGDVTKKYDSVYSIDLEILRLMEEGGGGGGTSSKVVRISKDWYNNQDNYQTEIKKALDDIYNEVSNNRSVTVIYDGFRSQSDSWVFETNNVMALNKNNINVYGLGWDKSVLLVNLTYDERSNHSRLYLEDKKFAVKGESPFIDVYKDGRINIVTNGNIAEFISQPIIDNEEFVVVKTTVPAYTGTDTPHHQVYRALNDNRYNYLLTKFCGMKLWWDEYNANYDLIPDGEWYVIFNEMEATTYTKIIVTKAVRNVNGTLDVYLGFKGYDIDSLTFWDCTVDNRNNQGGGGKWNEKNWTKVSDAQNISVDSFMARTTSYFCTNTEGVKVDRIVLFKRMK